MNVKNYHRTRRQTYKHTGQIKELPKGVFNLLKNHSINEQTDMASKRKQMTSKVRGVLERYIAPNGWKLPNDNTTCSGNFSNHTVVNDHELTIRDVELLTEEIVNLKLHGK